MGQSETYFDNDSRSRLLETAKAMVLRGDDAFSVASVCTEAGVELTAFRTHFSGKTALMAALMQAPATPETQTPVAVPEPVSKVALESAISTPDAWLERRLRVFERALNALETKAESVAREQARAIAQLEERLKAGSTPNSAAAPVPEPTLVALKPAPVALKEVVRRQDAAPAPQPVSAALPPPQELPQEPEVHCVTPVAEAPPAEEMETAPWVVSTPPAIAASKEEMAGVLQSAREKVRIVVEPPPPPPNSARMRWLTIGGLGLVALLLCIGLWLGKNMADASAQQSDGVTHRRAASGKLAQTIALADAGNTRAQARLALAYLRGQGAAGDANVALLWTRSAARAGNPVAQYLMGVMYQQGDHVMTDPVAAFGWFSRAAEKGNLKAMHNLAIAYAQGLGPAKDEAKAAEWFTRAAERGYVDSAFDLAVLYERGAGVAQDLKQALKWYGVAAMAGDAPAKERVGFLRGQMKAADIKLADNAAMAFTPLPPLDEANSL
jgi:AcrR family transcriptional regulator